MCSGNPEKQKNELYEPRRAPAGSETGASCDALSSDAWLQEASKLPGRSLHVAIALRLAADLKKSRKVTLTNTAAQRFGIDRNAKYRALEWLENAGLITVDRRPGRSPVVTIVNAGDTS